MKSVFKIFLSLILLFVILVPACKVRTKEHKKKDFVQESSVYKGYKTHEIKYNTIDARTNINMLIDNKKQAVSANLRIKKDSIIWGTANAFLGIEVARFVITQDSLKMINRLNNTYLLTDINYLKTLLNIDIDYLMLQSLLTATDFPHFNTSDFEIKNIDELYVLYADKRNSKINDKIFINQRIEIDTATFKILKNYVTDKDYNYSLETTYSNFRSIDAQFFPHRIDCFAKKGIDNLHVTIEYSRIVLDNDLSFPFSIPEKYNNMF